MQVDVIRLGVRSSSELTLRLKFLDVVQRVERQALLK